MRTGRSLTVFRSLQPGGGGEGGVPGPGGGTWSRGEGGVYLVPGGDVPGPGGVYLVPGGVGVGVYLVRGSVPGPGGCTWSCGGVYLLQGGTWSLGGVPDPGGCTWSRGGVYLVRGGVPGPRGVYLIWGVYLVPGVYLVWGGVPGPGGGTWFQGGVYPVRYSPLWTEWQTGVKILPWPKLRFGR